MGKVGDSRQSSFLVSEYFSQVRSQASTQTQKRTNKTPATIIPADDSDDEIDADVFSDDGSDDTSQEEVELAPPLDVPAMASRLRDSWDNIMGQGGFLFLDSIPWFPFLPVFFGRSCRCR